MRNFVSKDLLCLFFVYQWMPRMCMEHWIERNKTSTILLAITCYLMAIFNQTSTMFHGDNTKLKHTRLKAVVSVAFFSFSFVFVCSVTISFTSFYRCGIFLTFCKPIDRRIVDKNVSFFSGMLSQYLSNFVKSKKLIFR